MTTINELYQDALFRHAIGVEGYEEYLVERLITLLNDTEADLIAQIMDRYVRLGSGGRYLSDSKLKKLDAMLAKIKELRNRAWANVNSELRKELWDFANVEADFVREAFKKVVSLEGFALAAPAAAALRSAVFGQPFRMNANNSRTLSEWMAGLRQVDQERIHNALRIGYIEGQSIDEVMSRIRGTRAGRFRDGVLQLTRRQAETVVRTGLLHFANMSRDSVWAGNEDIIAGLRWTSVLDGRTTPVCRARDGKIAVFGDRDVPEGFDALIPNNVRPPAHAQCRSLMIAIIDGIGMVGTRPFVVDTRTGRKLKIDFQKISRQKGISIKQVRAEWADKYVGSAPAKTTYDEWLQSQSVEFQDQILGPTRGKLFRKGGLRLDDLVDRSGRQYNLDELLRRDAEAFRAAGLL